jgi:Fur family peroxide stress response transcriptional regulator
MEDGVDLDFVQDYNSSKMRSTEQSEMLREVGLVPTIQRLAILDCLSKSKLHPTADQVLLAVQRGFPSISRATVYNTLDALTKAGMVLRLNVDPAVARYDADLGPHAHFRCRVCQKVYDIEVKVRKPIDVSADGHLIESVRTYAYGVCASCRDKSGLPTDPKEFPQTKKPMASSSGPPSDGEKLAQTKKPKASSSSVPPRIHGKEARNA